MKINIKDPIDLKKIIESGQCFRPICLEDKTYRFITKKEVLYIKDLDKNDFDVSCDKATWERVWIPYFDLKTNYKKKTQMIPEDDLFMKEAAKVGSGIRILNQDPFEMLISFIISQRKNIPAIRSCVEKICAIYGDETDTGREKIHLFPTPKAIADNPTPLENCSLGYRLPYVLDAAKRVASGELNLDKAKRLSDDELLAFLMDIKGVGIKVASCVALFAYNRGGIAPVDTWINRVIEEKYNGKNPFPGYGENSGIYQQYAFYWCVNR